MRKVLLIAAATALGICSGANAAEARDCSKFELLKLTNRIDFMSSPEQQEHRCIALQEVMKARAALDLKNDEKCQEHMRNAILTVDGRPPSGLKPVEACSE